MRRPTAGASLILAASLFLGAPCTAQVSGLPSDLISAKTTLTQEQQSRLANYVDRVSGVFAKGTPSEVVAVRNEIVDLCRNLVASEIFRRELSVLLVKSFQPLTKSKETFRSTNAFLTAQFLRSAESLDFLVDNVDPEAQPDAGLRTSAAAQLPRAGTTSNLTPPQVDALAKRLVAAARIETGWMTIASETEAVGELLGMKLPAAQAAAVADAQASIINSITERVQDGSATQLIQALQRSLLVVRNQLTNAPAEPARGQRLLAGIAPSLSTIDRWTKTPPPGVASNPQYKAAFDSVIATASLLKRVGRPGA